MRTFRLASIVLTAALPLLAACSSEPKPLQVTYYYEPGCETCNSVKPDIQALAQEFPGRVEVALVSAEEEEAREDVRRLEFKTQGLVVRDFRGAVLIKQADHGVNLEEVRATLKQALGGAPAEDAEGAG
jgi:thiol-disulfide isomerase/thioredoxin